MKFRKLLVGIWVPVFQGFEILFTGSDFVGVRGQGEFEGVKLSERDFLSSSVFCKEKTTLSVRRFFCLYEALGWQERFSLL